MFWKIVVSAAAIAIVGGAIYLSGVTRAQLVTAINSAKHPVPRDDRQTAHSAWKPTARAPWNGLLTLTAPQRDAMGVRTAVVEAQIRPIKLELTGRTAYDDTTLTKIRPRFDTRVEKVHATIGDKVKKGDPLVELFSTELAQAKSDYQMKYVQWQHDVKLLAAREKLHREGAVSTQVLVDTQNDEMKSHLDFILAKDKLKIFNVPESAIAPLLRELSGGNVSDLGSLTNLTEKAHMTMLSPADGYVIERDVVVGNLYDTSSVLMTIAPLDHLWVWINVYENDQAKVHRDQRMEIQFPFLKETVEGRVEYVANEVSKDTRAVRVRATVRNPGIHLKADMLVKALLDIPPVPGQTIVPRQSVATFNGVFYVFVQRPSAGKDDAGDAHQYERRRIEIAQENTDTVVVRSGLKPGEIVVTAGSLVLSEVYEDQRMVDTGLPGS